MFLKFDYKQNCSSVYHVIGKPHCQSVQIPAKVFELIVLLPIFILLTKTKTKQMGKIKRFSTEVCSS